ncbi:MAG TPA: penicillin acylase family protein, partial [Micromonosporaceae bacterium]|nr:penicillin acylase family protein [Micromonosporaceae bacterium]
QSQVKTDTYLRTMGWRRVSEQEWPLLSAETQAALTSYAEGVNAWLAENPEGNSLEYTLLGLQNADYVIEKWHPVDSLSWLKAMAWDLRGNMEDEIKRAGMLAHGLTRQQVDELYPAYPHALNTAIIPAAAPQLAGDLGLVVGDSPDLSVSSPPQLQDRAGGSAGGSAGGAAALAAL